MTLSSTSPIVLDASVSLVLFATGQIRAVIQALPVPWLTLFRETIAECRFS